VMGRSEVLKGCLTKGCPDEKEGSSTKLALVWLVQNQKHKFIFVNIEKPKNPLLSR